MSIRVQVSCIAIRDNKMVFIKKTGRKDLATNNMLIPPGGHVELHESLEEACYREMFEETGLKVFELEMKGVISFIKHVSDYHSVCFFFISKNVKGDIIQSEDEIYPHWVDVDDIQINNLIPDYHKEFIGELLKGDNFVNAKVEWLKPDNRVEWSLNKNREVTYE